MDINKTNIEMKLCACGCGELIPTKNKLGKPATFKHGHNTKTEHEQGKRPFRPMHNMPHTGDKSRFGKAHIGVRPINAFPKGFHVSPPTEYTPGHINSEKNKQAVSEKAKYLWATDEEYRSKCIKAPRKKRKMTKPERKLLSYSRQLGLMPICNRWFKFERIPGKKHGCEPDQRIKKIMTIVFADNESYWHANPQKKQKDSYIDRKCQEFGYKVIRLTDKQIETLTIEEYAKLLGIDPDKGIVNTNLQDK